MASKVSTHFAFILLIFFLPYIPHYVISSKSNGKSVSPFEFLDNLKGCHEGDNTKGIHELKNYLQKFGYLTKTYSTDRIDPTSDNNFDKLLESAIKTYQLNYHIPPTGSLDAKTVTTMMMPRCGVPDIVNGTTSMRSGKKNQQHGSSTLHTVSHYAFFQGSPKWPASETQLTYGFLSGTPAEVNAPVGRAFDSWASVTQFTFSYTEDYANADLKISFQRGDHGDGYPFDGPGGILAHADAPTGGQLHFDGDETWAVGDIETVALHEIGHLLGLEHSSVEDAIMYPSISPGVSKGLNGDDVQGIKALYNV